MLNTSYICHISINPKLQCIKATSYIQSNEKPNICKHLMRSLIILERKLILVQEMGHGITKIFLLYIILGF